MNPSVEGQATCFAPASVSNLAVGFDAMGFSVPDLGDTVSVSVIDAPEVRVHGITGVITDLPTTKKNTGVAALEALRTALKLKHGFEIGIQKGIPLGSGLGGSAATAVAAVAAAGTLLGIQTDDPRLLDWALDGEAVASGGRHPDNVAPSLYGGFILVAPNLDGTPRVLKPSVPDWLEALVVLPDTTVLTHEARAALPEKIPRSTYVKQCARAAAFVHALAAGDAQTLRQVLVDDVVEPVRAGFIKGYQQVKAFCRDADCLGCSISGSGPTMFVLCDGRSVDRNHLEQGVLSAFGEVDVSARLWWSSLGGAGVVKR